jgi:lipid II:glycine glycyltransferase (peptidoglycan interpeptide bridge formation enzyme)
MEWDEFIQANPQSHLLQTSAWGELKSQFGWTTEQIIKGSAGAQIIYRSMPLLGPIAYIPRGPIGPWLPDLLPALDRACRSHGVMLLKVEPDEDDDAALSSELVAAGFRRSPHEVQPRRTIVLDLQGEEDALLAKMNQKTRYNIRLAFRKGVTVKPWEDLEAFSRMMSETAERNQFGAHTAAYYKAAYELFHAAEKCELLVAEAEGSALAALMVFAHGSRSADLCAAMGSYALGKGTRLRNLRSLGDSRRRLEET